MVGQNCERSHRGLTRASRLVWMYKLSMYGFACMTLHCHFPQILHLTRHDLHRRLPRCISLYHSKPVVHHSLDVRSTSGTVFVVVAMIIPCLSA